MWHSAAASQHEGDHRRRHTLDRWRWPLMTTRGRPAGSVASRRPVCRRAQLRARRNQQTQASGRAAPWARLPQGRRRRTWHAQQEESGWRHSMRVYLAGVPPRPAGAYPLPPLCHMRSGALQLGQGGRPNASARLFRCEAGSQEHRGRPPTPRGPTRWWQCFHGQPSTRRRLAEPPHGTGEAGARWDTCGEVAALGERQASSAGPSSRPAAVAGWPTDPGVGPPCHAGGLIGQPR